MCEVCANLQRLANLVRGPRFPSELRVGAARSLHSCYLSLLEEADRFFFVSGASAPATGSGERPGSAPSAPAPAAEGIKKERSASPKTTKPKDKDRRKQDKDKKRHREPKDQAEDTKHKEKKRSRREENAAEEEAQARVKKEEAEEDKSPLAPVTGWRGLLRGRGGIRSPQPQQEPFASKEVLSAS